MENVKNDADIFSVFCDAFLANYEGGLNEISPIWYEQEKNVSSSWKLYVLRRPFVCLRQLYFFPLLVFIPEYESSKQDAFLISSCADSDGC